MSEEERAMSSPKVFVFAPVAEARESYKKLEAEGCELRLGEPAWDSPNADSEPELVRSGWPRARTR